MVRRRLARLSSAAAAAAALAATGDAPSASADSNSAAAASSAIVSAASPAVSRPTPLDRRRDMDSLLLARFSSVGWAVTFIEAKLSFRFPNAS